MNSENLIGEVLSRNPRSVNKKDECYALYDAGFFGNKALTWNSYEEIVKSGWKGKVCMRGRLKAIDRGMVEYNIPLKKIPKVIWNWKRKGISEDKIGFNQSMPDKDLTIQGEVIETVGGIFLLYTTIKKPMNLALKKQELHVSGLRAKLLLENNLSPSSYSDIRELLEMFPNNVIEFSSYRVNVGNIPGRNTVIWEVRNY